MKGPLMTIFAALGLMLVGYFAGKYFGSQESWMLMAGFYVIGIAGAGLFIGGLIWSIYEMVWGGRWKL